MNTTRIALAALVLAMLATVPPVHAGKLAKIDRQIGTHAGVLGVNRLAADPRDASGLVLLQLAGKLRPTSETYLLTVARLEKGLPINRTKAKVTEEKLISVMVSRAEKLRKKAGKDDDDDAGQLALLYYRVVEHFLPADNKIMLGIMKLKLQGVKGELEEVLQNPISVLEKASSPVAGRSDSGRANALFTRAKATEAKGDHEQAQSLWKQFLAIEPEGERKTAVEYGWVTIATETVLLDLQSRNVFWSPDGKFLLHQSHNQWHVLELAIRKSTGIEGLAGVADVDAWHPDGRSVATHTRNHMVFLHEFSRGWKAKRTTRAPIASGKTLAFSPDGASLLVFGGTGDKRYPQYARAIIEIATGKVELVPSMNTPGRNAMTAVSWSPDGEGMTFLIFPGSTGDIGRRDCVIYSTRMGFKKDPVQLTPGKERLGRPAVSPNGLGVAYAAEVGAGNEARVVPFDGSAQPVTIGPGKMPHWCADSRSLALVVVGDGPGRVVIHRLGGIDRRPAEFAAKQTGHTLNVAMRNRMRESGTFNVTCEIFDDHSFRIHLAEVGQKKARLRPGGVTKFKIKLDSARKRGKYTAKLTAVTMKSARAIELIDLVVK